MLDDEFVYAVIPDHLTSVDRWDKILEKSAGGTSSKSHLELAIRAAIDSKYETGIDVVIVLSANEAVLDAASELGAVAHMAPGFFDVDSMIKAYVSDPGVDIDPSDDPYIVIVEPYSLSIGDPRPMSQIQK
ncbi:MAG: hypothetical protein F2550_02450 [Actinobacteria bacterium]|uniref:Unannotated protein n=1 Tax=freshwater metagenome TaxID=449393 RepID=A0A6J6D8S5_9ZZZZ|nr:hypothetical protein [Actinomycetota bacterium]